MLKKATVNLMALDANGSKSFVYMAVSVRNMYRVSWFRISILTPSASIGAAASGADLMTSSRGVAGADFWNRGLRDIAVSASTGRTARLKNELANRKNWLQAELVGLKSKRDAVGARVTAAVKGVRQTREAVLGDGYGSQNSGRQRFGSGGASTVDELTVKRPRAGIVQAFHNVAANRIIEITERHRELVEKRYRSFDR
jgi:hypothetical protein